MDWRKEGPPHHVAMFGGLLSLIHNLGTQGYNEGLFLKMFGDYWN
jgi:hypothetical protein